MNTYYDRIADPDPRRRGPAGNFTVAWRATASGHQLGMYAQRYGALVRRSCRWTTGKRRASSPGSVGDPADLAQRGWARADLHRHLHGPLRPGPRGVPVVDVANSDYWTVPTARPADASVLHSDRPAGFAAAARSTGTASSPRSSAPPRRPAEALAAPRGRELQRRACDASVLPLRGSALHDGHGGAVAVPAGRRDLASADGHLRPGGQEAPIHAAAVLVPAVFDVPLDDRSAPGSTCWPAQHRRSLRGSNYCPQHPSRGHMAVFVLKTLAHADSPACGTPMFNTFRPRTGSAPGSRSGAARDRDRLRQGYCRSRS